MTTDPQTDYAATIAERTVCVTWPDNDRGGATPPPDGWQDRAWEQPTLHEIDEGSITGCSVLRWRDDPRSDAELLAVSLALVTGQVVPPAAAAPPVVRPELRDQIAAAIDEGFRLAAELEDVNLGESITSSVLSVLPATTNRAAVYRELADLAEGDDGYITKQELRRMAREVERGADPSRMAVEAQQQTETEAHPAEHTWAAELHDPLADEWVPGTRYPVRERAVNALEHAKTIGPTWKDGAPTQRRLVRMTTTYTVEQPAVVTAVAGEEPADETQTLAAMFEGLHTLLATSSRDWGTYRVDAWLWAVLCGWDCEQAVHDETCTHSAMEEMQQQHGWDDETVAKARRYRAVVRAIENRAAVSQPGKEEN